MVETLFQILQGMLQNPYTFDMSGEKRCRYCRGSQRGYRDGEYFEHIQPCPVTLMKQLERERREEQQG